MGGTFYQNIRIPEGVGLAVNELATFLLKLREEMAEIDQQMLNRLYELMLTILREQLQENINLTQQLIDESFRMLSELMEKYGLLPPTSSEVSVKQIIAERDTTFFLYSNGVVKACGNNVFKQLGIDPNIETPENLVIEPTEVIIPRVKKVAGKYHTLFLTTEGIVWGVGFNENRQVDPSTREIIVTPRKITEISDYEIKIIDIACTEKYSLFVTAEGYLVGMSEEFRNVS